MEESLKKISTKWKEINERNVRKERKIDTLELETVELKKMNGKRMTENKILQDKMLHKMN